MAISNALSLTIRPVRTTSDRRKFLDLPYRLYRGDPNWVPPLRISQKDILDVKKHPFYKTSDVEMFLAQRGGRIVGRVMAILNRAHNEFHNEHAGFFGFFECEKDDEAARGLLDKASDWLKKHGAEFMRGPANPSTNYECALLVEGFDSPPVVMMSYNPPFYAEIFEAYGLKKGMDLYAYYIETRNFNVPEKMKAAAERYRTKSGVRVRSVNMKDFANEVQLVRKVYNDAWSTNWGFVPVSTEEFEHLAKDLKQLVDPEVVYIAEKIEEGRAPKTVGFFLAVPDLNMALKKLNGRLLPIGLLKLLYHSRKINQIRIITMGIIKEYQSVGMAALFYLEIYARAARAGYPNGEMSWILENNVLMNRAALMLGGRKYKTYRMYEKPL